MSIKQKGTNVHSRGIVIYQGGEVVERKGHYFNVCRIDKGQPFTARSWGIRPVMLVHSLSRSTQITACMMRHRERAPLNPC